MHSASDTAKTLSFHFQFHFPLTCTSSALKMLLAPKSKASQHASA